MATTIILETMDLKITLEMAEEMGEIEAEEGMEMDEVITPNPIVSYAVKLVIVLLCVIFATKKISTTQMGITTIMEATVVILLHLLTSLNLKF